MTSLINWIPTDKQLPDSDMNVLVFNEYENEPVWLGYHDGQRWNYVDGMPANPSHWSEIPRGPTA